MSAANEPKKLYIAGMGAITSVGCNVAMTAAAVNAGVSAYSESQYFDHKGRAIIMAMVPDEVVRESTAEIDEGIWYSTLHDFVIKLAIVAIKEACMNKVVIQPIPLIIGMPDVLPDVEHISDQCLFENLAANCQPWIKAGLCRAIHSGRAAGMEALSAAFSELHSSSADFVLIGGSDSYRNYTRLRPLGVAGRLLARDAADSFAPGEGAGFLLLTQRPELAQVRNGYAIALCQPGIADEPGHLYADEPYRGEGLDQAFKTALNGHLQPHISSIYSSMNGENTWAKEYGIAYLRNQNRVVDPVRVEHPAESYGDLGSATASVLIAVAAEHLFSVRGTGAVLVYSSSDTTKRGAVVIEKLAVN